MKRSICSRLDSLKSWALEGLENSLSPLPSQSKHYRIPHHLRAVYFLPLSLAGLTGAVLGNLFSSISCIFSEVEKLPHPLDDFSAITRDSRKWALLPSLAIKFKPSFSFGATTCTYQDSAKEDLIHSQWHTWEEKRVPKRNQSEKRSNLFQLYKTAEGRDLIVDRLQKLGLNAYRFSLEWSQIEPQEGQFDLDQLQIYIELCKALRKAGIAPEVTLHHFSEPRWFHEKGSFEKKENIPYFIAFATKVFPHLTGDYRGKPLVERIYTGNEFNIEAFCRNVLGSFSPGYKGRFAKAGQFLYHALQAHCIVYKTLKALSPKVQIGIVHQYLEMEPTNPLIAFVSRYLNRLLNETALHFYKTGIFDYKIPFFCHIYDDSMRWDTAESPLDFIGLQFYAKVVVGILGPTSYHEPMTLMPYRENPEGIYDAIKTVYAACKKPILISENGISTNDDVQRGRYMERALYAVWRAQQEIGEENLIGYNVWCPFPTSEWDMGWDPQDFSAYALEENGTICSEPKPGMQPFIRTALASKIE